ncbi:MULTISPECIES: 4Fe-4S ferredoxin [unclassified Fusibacter]|uniref:4Fe-4S ferredoxin n=1 Tax=unclassified Fusibacter TaxID=2624464 RepID=UPI001011ECD2|nr:MULTISPECIES: 4Fe-4S ferredoxin [unclassified Fusibacter]MCK8058829.1 proline dehydrogenase family protein [Fusibacter sp. A2]NPE21903.1 4Fe-4S ferredoxin [Fusibacter sp. A1]RXV61474.1 4Fe-4S ferredoxin [Fusibacter sp. A1]
MKKITPMKWTWILMVAFLTLGIVDFRFGILGVICMTAPLYHVLKGEGKVHCRKYCPRGSLLQRALEGISINGDMPKFMTTRHFKNILLGLMLTVFSVSMTHAAPDFTKMAFAMFRFMSLSLIIGILMGIFFKPRSWCVVCPMGHGAGLIDRELKKKANQRFPQAMETGGRLTKKAS